MIRLEMQSRFIYTSEEHITTTFRNFCQVLYDGNGVCIDPFQIRPIHSRTRKERFQVCKLLHMQIGTRTKDEEELKPIAESNFGLTILLNTRKQLDILFDTRRVQKVRKTKPNQILGGYTGTATTPARKQPRKIRINSIHGGYTSITKSPSESLFITSSTRYQLVVISKNIRNFVCNLIQILQQLHLQYKRIHHTREQHSLFHPSHNNEEQSYMSQKKE